MGVIIIVFRPRDFINVGVVLKVKSTLCIKFMHLKTQTQIPETLEMLDCYMLGSEPSRVDVCGYDTV